MRKILRLPSIATSGSPSSPPFPPHSTSPPRCRSATGSRQVVVATGRRERERTRNGNAGDRWSATSFCDGPAGTAYTRACTHDTHPHIDVHLPMTLRMHAAVAFCAKTHRGHRALSLSRAHTHARTHAHMSKSRCNVCSECIRGESAVALAARPANRVIGRRIHPSRPSCRASSRRTVCF